MGKECTFFDKNTSFRGHIETSELVVEGTVTGEVRASRQVTILSGASVNGPIRTTRILMEEGGRHSGAIRLSDTPPGETPAPVRTRAPNRSTGAVQVDQETSKESPKEAPREPVYSEAEDSGFERLW